MSRLHAAAVLGAALLLTARAALAQAPAAPAPPPLTRTTIDLGFVSASGNTSLRTLSLAEQFVLQPAQWKFTQTFSMVSGRTAGVETANDIRAGLRADYAFNPHFRSYGTLLYERNRFAGIARRFEEQVGLSYGALVGPTHILDLEAGAGRNQQTNTAAPVTDFWLGRAAAHYRFTFRANSYVDEKMEVLQSLQQSGARRINSELAVVAPLSTRIAVRLGHSLHFVNQPPPGFKKTDQIVSSGLQIIF